MSNTAQLIAAALDVQPFDDRFDNATGNAQHNLEGRSHYADPGTLRYHKSRILSARPISNGAFFLILESCALDYENTRRGARAALFDLSGHAVYRPKLDECHRTREQASKAFWAWFDTFDESAHYLESIRQRAEKLAEQAATLRQVAATLESEQTTEA
jgi:hypothetical protein